MNSKYKSPVRNHELHEMQQINEQKRKAAIEVLGESYILHPANHIQRKDEKCEIYYWH